MGLPMGICSEPAPAAPTPPHPPTLGNQSLVATPKPATEGRQPQSTSRWEFSTLGTASRRGAAGNPPECQAIIHLREGAVLQHDNVNTTRGTYIRELNFLFLMEFSQVREVAAVSSPRDGQGRPSGYATIEHGNPNQAAAAIFGMRGWCMGDGEWEVSLMHRKIEGANARGRHGPRSGTNVWNTGD